MKRTNELVAGKLLYVWHCKGSGGVSFPGTRLHSVDLRVRDFLPRSFGVSLSLNDIFAFYDFLWVDISHPVEVLFLLSQSSDRLQQCFEIRCTLI